jgi:ergothioneine biosynthesis protein EgtB
MANSLAIGLEAGRPRARGRAGAGRLEMPAGERETGSRASACAFDNEMPAQRISLASYAIDAEPVSNGAFAEFVAAGGYDQPRYWTDAGWDWRRQGSPGWPRHWRRAGRQWQQRWFGDWEAIADEAPVSNISAHEADAWCRWAGRRLPSEAEWECAALAHGPLDGRRGAGAFCWGEVWEWTADSFAPYPGFVAHPYRDYSQPWFGSRRSLRGASFATAARMRHPRYRNFFPAARNDIFAGFRSCAPAP